MRIIILILVALCAVINSNAQEDIKALRDEIILAATIDEVWQAWTTEEGLKSFFASDCNVELRVDGLYEIYFDPEAEPGNRGADSMRVMAIEPKKMFSFTWNAPQRFPSVRKQRTLVVLKFKDLGPQKTKVILTQTGWGDGPEWEQVFQFFEKSWNTVLRRLKYRFDIGPIDWHKVPAELEW